MSRRRNAKFKYAIKKELDWLNDDIRIINEMLDGESPLTHSREIELRLRRIWADKEIGRLLLWLREYKSGLAVKWDD